MRLAALRRWRWFNKQFTSRTKPRAKSGRPRAVLRVQQLEDRCVPSIVYVDPTGIGPNGKHAYKTIHSAVNTVPGGTTIVVDPGSYTEDVTITKAGISLLGAQAGINPVPGRSGAESTLNGSITFTAANVTVNGFTIDSTEHVALQAGWSSGAGATNAIIVNNIVNASIYGIYVGSANALTTLFADVQDNVVTGAQADIALFNTSFNTVEGNLILQAPLAGVDTYYANNNAILGNVVNDCATFGIRLRGSQYDLIANNSGSNDLVPVGRTIRP
jgi:parallel beta-helix repeat protein